jgi:hypothetical protein
VGGSKGTGWFRRREALCSGGFSAAQTNFFREICVPQEKFFCVNYVTVSG